MGDNLTTGMKGLDKVLQGLKLGDNVVWQLDDIDDYYDFVHPFIEENLNKDKKIIYMRFAQHQPLCHLQRDNIKVYELDPSQGFESFAVQIHKIIRKQERKTHYIFDCLSDLLLTWATDLMVGNFFKVVCPYLFELDAIAYFPLLRNKHSYTTVDRIQEITQVFLDLYKYKDKYYIHPLKVEGRYTTTMFFPHLKEGHDFSPIRESYEISDLFHEFKKEKDTPQRNLDYWEKVFLEAKELEESENDVKEKEIIIDKICEIMLGKDERIINLVKKNFDLDDLLKIKSRLIGSGYIGGKSLGMLLARKILENNNNYNFHKYLEEHDSFYIGSDVFYTYLVQNDWWKLWVKHKSSSHYYKVAEQLQEKMLKGHFPSEIKEQFRNLINYFGQSPIIVRSSSLLEDSYGNAFAGKYDSYFCVNQGTPEARYSKFEDIVRKIYASTMNEDALKYRQERGLDKKEEQMSLLVQRVSGTYRKHYYFPLVAGVGFSYNCFTWKKKLDPEAGMLRLVFGLGTRAVERTIKDYPRIVALDDVNLKANAGLEDERKYSQHDLDLLNLKSNEFATKSISKLAGEIPQLDNIDMVGKRDYDSNRKMKKLGIKDRESWIITFDKLLTDTNFTVILKNILKTLEKAYQYPVDIEFTANFTKDGNVKINLLQCRPLQTHRKEEQVDVPENIVQEHVLFNSKGNFMGGIFFRTIDKIIYINPEAYFNLIETDKYKIARILGKVNRRIGQESNILLIGPGRWGTTTPSLGVPVSFADINNVSVLVELDYKEGYIRPELSFGTHFFQDLVEAEILYIALFPQESNCYFCIEHLSNYTNRLDKYITGKKFEKVLKIFEPQVPLRIYSDLVSQRVIGFWDNINGEFEEYSDKKIPSLVNK